MNDIAKKNSEQILLNRAHFSSYNVVRMREAIRYLSDDKLKIFIEIPFLIHINSPGYKGYIDSKYHVRGIWNFRNSGFFKQVVKKKLFPLEIIEKNKNIEPMILGLYHIGSLGTFTQSTDSDFDYWVVIDSSTLKKKHLECLEKKLDMIVHYSREKYEQQVTFFIMDYKDIQQNSFPPLIGKNAFTAPKFFLKEEFFRTFLMIAGKIPSWALIYQNVKPDAHNKILNSMPQDVIDFGNIDYAKEEDILKGLLWHVLKSIQNPVKALIKATMIFSYWFGSASHKKLLCNVLRSGYSKAGLDDYSMDPYKILFDRVIEYHEQNETKGLNMIKSALFFRLCGYPSVKMPPENFPQRHLLEKYIYNWGLKKKQVVKLLKFQQWSESEKLVFEQTILTRLKKMYEIALNEFGQRVALDFFKGDEQRNWKILQNKTKKRLRQEPGKISDCSSFLKKKKIKLLRFQLDQSGMWQLLSIDTKTRTVEKLYKNPCLFKIFGWILANRLYNRNNAIIDYKHIFDIYESTQYSISFDNIYLSLQPLRPLSDSSFEQDPKWKKSAVLLVFSQDKTSGISNLDRAEFLITNTWGEIFFENIEFNQKGNIKEKCEKIALKLVRFYDANFRFFIYQLTGEHNSDIIYYIKRAYEINTSDKIDTVNQNSIMKPYLDIL